MLSCLHLAVFSFIHFCIVPFSSFFFFSSYFITRNTSGSLNYWRNHRMLVTNIAPCPWEIPHYRCPWATQTWVWARKVHHKNLIWGFLLQVMLTLRAAPHEVTSQHLVQSRYLPAWGQGPKYWSKKSIFILHFSSLNPYKKYIKNHVGIYSAFLNGTVCMNYLRAKI